LRAVVAFLAAGLRVVVFVGFFAIAIVLLQSSDCFRKRNKR
jgi:type IV secretory pathway TrbL component